MKIAVGCMYKELNRLQAGRCAEMSRAGRSAETSGRNSRVGEKGTRDRNS